MAESEFRISRDLAGIRLDLALGQSLALSRAQVKKLLENRQVRVNGRRVGLKHKGDFLEVGSMVSVEAFARPEDQRAIAQEDLALKVISEGEGWVIVDKPAGMPVHPLEAQETGTALNWVISQYPAIHGVGEGGLRSGVVHRLDVDTSGVLLFATDSMVWEAMRDSFSTHQTRKIYRAIVQGELAGSGREVMELVVSQHRPAKVSAVKEKVAGSRKCHLEWRAIERLNDATLVEVNLGTGFLHQIRVMMAELGHAVLGDGVYGSAEAAARAPRQMLHASLIEAGEARGESGDPADFAETLNRLRAG